MAAGGGRRRDSASSQPHDRPVSLISDAGSNANVFDDDYSTEYAESISAPSELGVTEDPFQDPSPSASNLAENPFQPSEVPQPSRTLQQRNSTRKSLLFRRHGSSNSLRRTEGALPSSAPQIRRSLSVASAFSYAAPQSPGANEHGPSHPYALYPQVMGVSRTASLSNSSSRRSSSLRSIRSRQGPTHPYNLYPQDVSPVGFEASPSNQAHVGFPGHVQRFHRRIGPEGEEQDIVGLDGHTEQLPPYTRYPDDETSKLVAGTSPVGQSAPRPPRESAMMADQTPPDLPTLAHVNHEQDHNSAQAASVATTEDSLRPAQSEKSWSGKSWSERSWMEKSKTRLCGCIPLWVIFLIIAVVIFIVVVCSAVITSALNHNKAEIAAGQTAQDHYPPPPKSSYSASTTTTDVSYIDAVPTSTPRNMAPLPTGTFIVPLGTPDQEYGQCLSQDQMQAWTCDLPAEQSMCVKLYQHQGRAVFSTCNNQSVILGYGTQLPAIYSQTLKLVSDLDNQTLGAAWHFQTFYDKLVIIPEAMLLTSSQQKRELSLSESWPSFSHLRVEERQGQLSGPVEVGDQAWFCAWDDTFIEGFIYASVSNPASAPAADPSATLYSETNPITWTMSTPVVTGTAGLAMEYMDYPPPPMPPNGYYSAGATYYPGQRRDADDDDYSSASSVDESSGSIASSTTDSTTSPHSTSGSVSTSCTTGAPTKPSATCIPKLVKFEERRLQGLHDTAICTLMRKMDDLNFVTVNDADEQPITVSLVEDDGPQGPGGPEGGSAKAKRWLERGVLGPAGGGAALERRQQYQPWTVDQTCYCQWSSEQFD